MTMKLRLNTNRIARDLMESKAPKITYDANDKPLRAIPVTYIKSGSRNLKGFVYA